MLEKLSPDEMLLLELFFSATKYHPAFKEWTALNETDLLGEETADQSRDLGDDCHTAYCSFLIKKFKLIKM